MSGFINLCLIPLSKWELGAGSYQASPTPDPPRILLFLLLKHVPSHVQLSLPHRY